jgi:8-hydroxy-5-deazaflavin:NADPH oxidoreductase
MKAMKIGVLGTGVVGTTIGSKLVALGHDVMLGARSATNEKAAVWVGETGKRASHGTFTAAAAHGEIVFNCTAGTGAVAAVTAAGVDNLRGKILIDVSNPLDFSKGMPPSSMFRGDDSLGEQIQRAVPEALVVKTLNTVNAHVMVAPGQVNGGDHHVFVCGDDGHAKARVKEILHAWFDWKHVIDLGDMTGARGCEAYVLFWVRLWGAQSTADFNIKVVK